MKNLKYHLLSTFDEDHCEEYEMQDIQTEAPIINKLDDKNILIKPLLSKWSCQPIFGIVFAFLSCCFFAFGSLLAKLSQGSIDAVQIAFIRCFIQLLLSTIFIIYCRLGLWQNFSWTTRTILMLRGLFGGLALVLLFYAFQNMPLGDASAIVFSSSIYTVVFARVFLKENFGLFDVVILLGTIVGIIFISKPTALFPSNKTANTFTILKQNISDNETTPLFIVNDSNLTFGTIAAISSSILIACSHITLRKLPFVHYTVPLTYLSMVGIIITSLSLIITKTFAIPNDKKYWCYALLIGVSGFAGQVFMTKAYQIEKAGIVAVIRQCDIVFAYIFQVTVFLDPLSVTSSIGTFLVVGGSIAIALKKLINVSKS